MADFDPEAPISSDTVDTKPLTYDTVTQRDIVVASCKKRVTSHL